MRLTVIGSSPAWPNPGSAQSGYLLEADGRLLVECGPGVLARLRDADAVDVDAIAITHFHLDHWGDLVPWCWLAAHGSARPKTRPELWVPPGGREQLVTFSEIWGNTGMFDGVFEVREFEEGTPFRAAGFEVEARAVLHYSVSAFGFRVRDPRNGVVLAYSGDCGPSDSLADLARGADLFVCEATLERGDVEEDPRGHLAADEALAAADGPILLTHRPIELPPPDGVPVAYDGLVVEI